MKSYKVIYHPKAERFLKKNKQIGLKFYMTFEALSLNRHEFIKYDIKKLKGVNNANSFRLRIGNYRAIFRIIDSEIVIFVIDIDHRGSIY